MNVKNSYRNRAKLALVYSQLLKSKFEKCYSRAPGGRKSEHGSRVNYFFNLR